MRNCGWCIVICRLQKMLLERYLLFYDHNHDLILPTYVFICRIPNVKIRLHADSKFWRYGLFHVLILWHLGFSVCLVYLNIYSVFWLDFYQNATSLIKSNCKMIFIPCTVSCNGGMTGIRCLVWWTVRNSTTKCLDLYWNSFIRTWHAINQYQLEKKFILWSYNHRKFFKQS